MLIIIAAIVALLLLVRIGFLIQPRPFPALPLSDPLVPVTSIPSGLPAPVDRFYRRLYPSGIPAIESAVVIGRVSIHAWGLSFPGRFRITHIAGKRSRQYIEATLFGFPVLKLDEHLTGGQGRRMRSFRMLRNGPKVSQTANIGMWATTIWLPAVLLNDSRVDWQPIDTTMALLSVPFGDDTERIGVRFDPASRLIDSLESMRYRYTESEHRILHCSRSDKWKRIRGNLLPIKGSTTWLDDGRTSMTFHVDDVAYNIDVRQFLCAGSA